MGLDTNYCLIFYGLTLIHLTGPLSQVVQLKCVMCNIYIYIYIYVFICIYIYRERCLHFLREHPFFFLRALPQTHSHTPLWTEFWGLKGRAHWSFILGASRTRKADYWTSKVAEMASQSTNQGNGLNFAVKCMLNLSTCDPMKFKFSSWHPVPRYSSNSIGISMIKVNSDENTSLCSNSNTTCNQGNSSLFWST